MGFRKADEFYISLGLGKTSVQVVVNKSCTASRRGKAVAEAAPPASRPAGRRPRRPRPRATSASRWTALADVLVRLAKCCKPVPGDPILGYISLGREDHDPPGGLSQREALQRNTERFTAVRWGGANQQSFRVEIAVDAWDRRGCSRTCPGPSPRTASTSSPRTARWRPDGPRPLHGRRLGDVDTLKAAVNALRNVESVFDAGAGLLTPAGPGVRPGHLVPWRPVEWLDLVVPTVAILAAFAAIGLIVTAIRQGRAIRRLEERLARTGDAAIGRAAAADRRPPGSPRHLLEQVARHPAPGRMGAVISHGLILMPPVLGSGTCSSATTAPPRPTPARRPPPNRPKAPPRPGPGGGAGRTSRRSTRAPTTVAVFNASGIDGVAGDIVAPALENEGYQVPLVANPPDDSDRQKSVVMYSQGQRKAAQNVAKDLGVAQAPPLDAGTRTTRSATRTSSCSWAWTSPTGGIAATP